MKASVLLPLLRAVHRGPRERISGSGRGADVEDAGEVHLTNGVQEEEEVTAASQEEALVASEDGILRLPSTCPLILVDPTVARDLLLLRLLLLVTTAMEVKDKTSQRQKRRR